MQNDNLTRRRRFDTIARTLALAAIFIMLFSLSVGYYAATLPTPAPTPTETRTPAPTPTPTPTRTPPPTARLTPGVRQVYIPGLTPEALRTRFQANLFVCTESEIGASGYYQWSCVQQSATIRSELVVYSRSAGTVDKIVATVSQPENPFLGSALRFFRLVVQTRYDGADPRSAEDWLTITLPTVASDEEFRRAVFGEVLFVLTGTPAHWTLEIGELPEIESGP
ncbi:MAG TPA: hypothetical protein VLH85_02400 [Levilinea sp.]|nr:hypothetical protein [Levilinea sp.]